MIAQTFATIPVGQVVEWAYLEPTGIAADSIRLTEESVRISFTNVVGMVNRVVFFDRMLFAYTFDNMRLSGDNLTLEWESHEV